MKKWAYYNEHDAYAAQWIRNLIAAGHVAPGEVDERSIEDVCPDDVRGFTQCHFFAGISVWSLALRRAGWPDDRAVWTGSCPCQPFSAAGAGAGFADERHLWPSFAWLIAQCKPPVVFGEQVASKAVEPWVDLVHADLEALGYAFGAVPFPSAGVGAPHVRDRLYWVADAHGEPGGQGRQIDRGRDSGSDAQARARLRGSGVPDGLADANGGNPGAERQQCGGQQRQQPENGGSTPSIDPGPVNGFWRDADWLGCRDDKWRPVEPGTFPLANGAPSRMVCVCPDCETETVIYESMHSLRSVPLRDEGRGTEEILRQGMLQAASFVAASHKQKYRALPGQGCREEQGLQSLRSTDELGSPSQGSKCAERQPAQSGEDLLNLSRLGTSDEYPGVDLRGMWGELHRSLASEPEQDLLCPLCKRVGPQKCTEEVGGSRVGRLRAYGNAINAEAATQFIASYLEIPHVIYATSYNPATLACTGPSVDSGFSTLDEVPMLLGEPDMRHPRMLTYVAAGVAYSDFVLHIDTGVSDVAGFVQSPTGST